MSSSVNSEGYSANNVEEIVDNNSDLMNDLQIGRKFNSFQEVQDLLSKLKTFNHPMRVFNSQSVEDYNNRRAKAKKPLEPIDDKWKFAYYVIACVHFGQPRQRSNGIRCNQRHLAIQSPQQKLPYHMTENSNALFLNIVHWNIIIELVVRL